MASATNSAQTPALMPTARNVAKTRSLEPSGLAVSRSTAGDDDCVQGFDDPWTRRTDELLQIRKLADDWDGLGAEAPSSGIVDSAIDLLKKLKAEAALPAPSRAAAAPTGTVILEWQFGGTYLEAEITRPYYAEWMLQRPGQPARHWAMT